MLLLKKIFRYTILYADYLDDSEYVLEIFLEKSIKTTFLEAKYLLIQSLEKSIAVPG